MGVFEKDRLKEKEMVMEQYLVRFYRGLGTSLARKLERTKITPNNITFSAFILLLAAGALFATGNYYCSLTAAAVLFFSIVLDFTDGTLARLKGRSSMFGDWFDAMSDEMREVVITVCLCIGVYRYMPFMTVWYMGIIMLTSDRLIFRTTNKLYKILPYAEGEISGEVKGIFSGGPLFRIAKEFLSVRLLKYTVLPVFIAFDELYSYMIFAALYGLVLCAAFFGYSIFRIKKEEAKQLK